MWESWNFWNIVSRLGMGLTDSSIKHVSVNSVVSSWIPKSLKYVAFRNPFLRSILYDFDIKWSDCKPKDNVLGFNFGSTKHRTGHRVFNCLAPSTAPGTGILLNEHQAPHRAPTGVHLCDPVRCESKHG